MNKPLKPRESKPVELVPNKPQTRQPELIEFTTFFKMTGAGVERIYPREEPFVFNAKFVSVATRSRSPKFQNQMKF